MSLVTLQKSGSLEVFNPGTREILTTFQASAEMTKAEGQELESAFERYQTETQTLIASMFAENLKYQLALSEALQRETSSSFIHTKTVDAMQQRIDSLEGTLKETREAMLREAEKAKVQMADMIKSHATALQTALAACSANAKAEEGALRSQLAKVQTELDKIQPKVQNAWGKIHSWVLSFKCLRQTYTNPSRIWNGAEECDRLIHCLECLETDLNPFKE